MPARTRFGHACRRHASDSGYGNGFASPLPRRLNAFSSTNSACCCAPSCSATPSGLARLQAAGVGPEISSLADFRRLPFTTKQELVDDQNTHAPYGTNLTFPLPQYIRLHQTSGTTGRPMRWLDTQDSWDWFMRCWSQIYTAAGVERDAVVAFPFSFGPFIGFWAAFDGAVRRGYRSLPLGGLATETRLDVIVENRATVVCCTPTYALRMTDVAEQRGMDLRQGVGPAVHLRR